MKNLLKKIRFSPPLGGGGLLLGLLLAYALNSCSLFPEPDPTLPPITQNGAETFGCLVNGKVFVAKGGGKYNGLTKDFYGGLNIFGLYVKSGEVESSLGFSTPFISDIGKYVLKEPKSIWYRAFHDRNLAPLNASVTITKFERGEDKVNNLRWLIISGTFEGILLPEGRYTDTVKITQGRFDIKFN